MSETKLYYVLRWNRVRDRSYPQHEVRPMPVDPGNDYVVLETDLPFAEADKKRIAFEKGKVEYLLDKARAKSVQAKEETSQQVFEATPEAEIVGRQIAIQITNGNYVACHDILDHAEEESKEPPLGAATIAELNLDLRWINALDNAGYLYIHQLTSTVMEGLRDELTEVGRLGMLAIEAALKEYKGNDTGTGPSQTS